MSLYYLNGDRNSNMRINTNGKLFKWLEDNYYVDENQLLISKDVLEAIQEHQPELEQHESILVGHLIYNLSYNGGYIFREILGFEDLISEVSDNHLTGLELENSDEYDTIMLIRSIENHQDEINNDEFFWEEKKTYPQQFKYLYDEYCATQLNKQKINHTAIAKAISLL